MLITVRYGQVQNLIGLQITVKSVSFLYRSSVRESEWIRVHSVYLWLVTCWIILNKFSTSIAVHGDDHREEWVVRIQGGSQIASLLALQSGYKHLGPVRQSIKKLYTRLMKDFNKHTYVYVFKENLRVRIRSVYILELLQLIQWKLRRKLFFFFVCLFFRLTP